MKKKCLKLISTDSVGWLGKPEQFVDLYKEYFKDGTFDGVETIAFKPIKRLKKIVSVLEKNEISTISFHSKTGGENRLPPKYGIIMTIVNSFIFGVEDLYKYFRNKEFLFHTPYLENKKIKQFIIKNKPKTLWIENHTYGKKGIEETVVQIKDYRNKGINAYGMLDLFHLWAKIPATEMKKNWPVMIKKVKGYIKWFSGIHFPIGSRKDDSLPIEEMNDDMLFLFGEQITPFIDRLVIENQQADVGLFFSTESMLKKQKERNKINFLRLKKAGIL